MQSDLINLTKKKNSILQLDNERNQKFYGIMLTLCALAFFGFFAIRPTISTILKLQKEITDNRFVLDQMKTKIKNLTELRKQYFNLQNDLPIINDAITTQPDVQILFAQIQSIAQTTNISMEKLQNFEVEILRNDIGTNNNYHAYSFTVAGTGTFENISKFVQTLTNMERITNIDTFAVNDMTDKDGGSLGFNIQGTAFFKDGL